MAELWGRLQDRLGLTRTSRLGLRAGLKLSSGLSLCGKLRLGACVDRPVEVSSVVSTYQRMVMSRTRVGVRVKA